LRIAAVEQPSNLQVANEMACGRNTVAHWRSRYLQHGLAGLLDALRSGRPRSFSPR
jgi:transposase